MMKAAFALFLVLDGTQALWLNADADTDQTPAAAKPAWGPPVKPPAIKRNEGGLPLMSGDAFSLESEVSPGHFIHIRPHTLDAMGEPMQWLEMRHISNGGFGLQPGVASTSTFHMHNDREGGIQSGDMVKWGHEAGQVDLLLSLASDNGGEKAFMWPHPMVKKQFNKGEKGDFLIEHARDLDLEEMAKRPSSYQAWGWDSKVVTDPRRGEEIKDGDSVWIRHKAATGSTAGDWLYMSADPAEGNHVSFPHHYPGFDGHVKHYGVEHWAKGGNDPHATASRFTVRKLGKDAPKAAPPSAEDKIAYRDLKGNALDIKGKYLNKELEAERQAQIMKDSGYLH